MKLFITVVLYIQQSALHLFFSTAYTVAMREVSTSYTYDVAMQFNRIFFCSFPYTLNSSQLDVYIFNHLLICGNPGIMKEKNTNYPLDPKTRHLSPLTINIGRITPLTQFKVVLVLRDSLVSNFFLKK